MRRLPNVEYTVGWICALPVELTAARAVLDEEHDRLQAQQQSDWNSYDVVQLLINSLVDVNAADRNGITALHWAIRKRQAHTSQLLLRHGADINLTDVNGMSAVDWAREFGGTYFLQHFSHSSTAIENYASGYKQSIGAWLEGHGYKEHMLSM